MNQQQQNHCPRRDSIHINPLYILESAIWFDTADEFNNLVKFWFDMYGKSPKISSFFSETLFSNKMFVFIAGIHKRLVKIANRVDPDQTASSEAV